MNNVLANKSIIRYGHVTLSAFLRDYNEPTGFSFNYLVEFTRYEDGLVVETGTKLFHNYNSAALYFNKLN